MDGEAGRLGPLVGRSGPEGRDDSLERNIRRTRALMGPPDTAASLQTGKSHRPTRLTTSQKDPRGAVTEKFRLWTSREEAFEGVYSSLLPRPKDGQARAPLGATFTDVSQRGAH
ncbi:hypothetical protein AALO_G00234480 [Alosa alosa]|uniref:Uncharacterized protein n=1 Tax=Alosa alosa TaxID=278164 RepID=A0AAV6FUX6_9TELE|nr:hypothetical protein AALO_G00234480 [Alosa alosa]